MKSSSKLILSSFALFGALAAIPSVPALAGTPSTFNFVGVSPNTEAINISTNGGSTYIDAYAGQYEGNFNGGSSFDIFCVDPTNEIQDGDSYTANTNYDITSTPGPLDGSYYSGGLGSELNSSDVPTNVVLTSGAQQARSDEVAWLADNYLNATSFTNAIDTNVRDNFSAVSLSIWDILMDGGNGLGSGLFQAQPDSSVTNLVTYYENQASSETGFTSNNAEWIQAPVAQDGSHLQSYVMIVPNSPSAVPEPAPATIVGIGALILFAGAAMARRRAAGPA